MSSPAILSPNSALNALNSLNPLAPPVYGGLIGPDGSIDFTYLYDAALVASAASSDVIKTNTDADFHLCGVVIAAYTSIKFSFRLNINGVYYTSSSLVLAANIAGDPSAPAPTLGRFVIPRGADINIDLQELSGFTNTIQILFRGMKLYGGGSRNVPSQRPAYGLGSR